MLERLRRIAFGRSTAELQAELERIGREVDALRRQSRLEMKWRQKMVQKLDALLRAQYLDLLADDAPFSLEARRFNLYSQNEEDGMLLALLRAAGTGTRRFVEIGSGSTGGNSAILAREFGFSGLMVDRDERKVAACRARFRANTGVRCVAATVRDDNLDELLALHDCTGEVDVFSLDIDSYDYWVFRAMTACSPRVIVLEYNAHFGPREAITIPADVPLDGVFKGYHGASLAAMDRAATEKGYRLVACDRSGTNAFFLRDDVAPSVAAVPVDRAFHPAADRHDPLEAGERKPIDIVSKARRAGLPLEYL